jgi:hypothetical protein
MTEAEEDITLFNSLTNKEVWLYVNPISGSHAKLKEDPATLAVFSDEKIGRSYERRSKQLRTMIGYYAEWEEMIHIAKKETNGKYTLYMEPDT